MKYLVTSLLLALVISASAMAGSQFVDRGARAQARAAMTIAKQARAANRALNVRVQDLEIQNNCLKPVVGITQYSGYRWTDGVNEFTTTALDVTPSGQNPSAIFQLVDPACVTQSNSFHGNSISPDAKSAWKRHFQRMTRKH